MSVRERITHATIPAEHQQARQAWETGRRRRLHDDRNEALAAELASAEQDRRTRCLQRWAGITAAIRALVAAYNDGGGAELLTVSDRSGDGDPAVTIASQDRSRGSVTVSVDDDALLVQTDQIPARATGSTSATRRVDCSRSDLGTAAYLLQPWMDQIARDSG